MFIVGPRAYTAVPVSFIFQHSLRALVLLTQNWAAAGRYRNEQLAKCPRPQV